MVPNNYSHHSELPFVFLFVKKPSNVKYYQKRHIIVDLEYQEELSLLQYQDVNFMHDC